MASIRYRAPWRVMVKGDDKPKDGRPFTARGVTLQCLAPIARVGT